ncbi:MAG: DMP19 family protein [Actinomycetota bacterium]|nr:DMP19 family protein [Actinomycetota bacterium]
MEHFSDLTPGQRAVCAVWALASDVLSDGLHGYLWNSNGYTANDAVIGAQLLGLDDYVSALEPVLQAFPNGRVPFDQVERREALEAIADTANEAAFQLADDRLSELVDAYPNDLQQHAGKYILQAPHDFFLPDEPENQPGNQ